MKTKQYEQILNTSICDIYLPKHIDETINVRYNLFDLVEAVNLLVSFII